MGRFVHVGNLPQGLLVSHMVQESLAHRGRHGCNGNPIDGVHMPTGSQHVQQTLLVFREGLRVVYETQGRLHISRVIVRILDGRQNLRVICVILRDGNCTAVDQGGQFIKVRVGNVGVIVVYGGFRVVGESDA